MALLQKVKQIALKGLLNDYERRIMAGLRGQVPRTCPCCGYIGPFRAFGLPPRYDAQCARCGSLERHRLLQLAIDRLPLFKTGESLLHFAPETFFIKTMKPEGVEYVTADLEPGRGDLTLNIEQIELPDATFDVVLASHVLEHVDEREALGELYRILKPGGKLLLMFPIAEGWDETYANPAITSESDRDLHFGQGDHVRYFGRDVRARISEAGFALTEFTGSGAEAVTFALVRGERLFIGQKAK